MIEYGVDSDGNMAICRTGDRVWRFTEVPGRLYRIDDDRATRILDTMEEKRLDRFIAAEKAILARKS